MKATESQLLPFLKKSPQFIIPIYQRTYSWGREQCLQLWNDILRAGRSETIPSHFIGSIVYIEQDQLQVSSQSKLLVIDGQQRLTTVSLIIEALSRHLADSEPIPGFSGKKLRNYYLLNELEDYDLRYKLLLTKTDKHTLQAIMKQEPPSDEYSSGVKDNFKLFEEWIKGMGEDLVPLCKGLEKLMIVDVALTRGQENPQLIFESLNSTGLNLTQADLIRNFVLMGLDSAHQEELYTEHWRPMEEIFGSNYSTNFDKFVRHYLIVKTGEIPIMQRVYDEFKKHADNYTSEPNGVDNLVSDLHKFANYYCNITFDLENNPDLNTAFYDLNELKVDVYVPLLLTLYDEYSKVKLSPRELVEAVRLIESYIFRRAVCDIPTNSHNTTFATFSKSLDEDHCLASIHNHFLSLPHYRRFPDDDEFQQKIRERDLYYFRHRNYWLRKLENNDRKERISVSEYTIEHILPQNDNLSKSWQGALGENWQQVQQDLLHTIGNLTLTGYNSEYSDRTFEQKRDMVGGFRESPLRLNEGLGQVMVWNEDAIRERAERLSLMAVNVWQAPSAPE